MRRVRRLTALVIQLLVLQLAMAGGAAPCAMAHPAPSAHAHHHDGGRHAAPPCAPDLCTADGHCAAAAALPSGSAEPRPAESGGRRVHVVAGVPSSVSAAPETPPPRA